MPRRKTLRVVGFPALTVGVAYLLRVLKIKTEQNTGVLVVTGEHLNKEQEGRIQEVVLPLPVRPSGRTAMFFQACGMEVSVNANIVPEDAVGKVIAARFEPTSGFGDWEPVSSGTSDEETRRAPESE